MLKKVTISLLLLFTLQDSVLAKKVGDADIPELLRVEQYELTLNGAGLKKRFFFKASACGLYLKEKESDFKKIIAADELMAIRMHILFKMDIPGKHMKREWRRIFNRVYRGNDEALKEDIDTFVALTPDKTLKNDVRDYVYIPGKGVHVYHNGVLKGVFKGLEFKKILFSVWLGEKNQNEGEKLKEWMLGTRN